MLERNCPTVIKLFTQQLEYAYVTLANERDLGGIAINVKLDTGVPLMQMLGEPSVVDAVGKVFDFSCELYTEIQKSCPFEGWKKGLREI